VAHQ